MRSALLYEFVDPKKKALKVKIENTDDLWLLYTLLKEGDQVTARTQREVKQGEGEKSRRVPMILTINVKHMEFQPFTNRLRIRGKVLEGPDTFGILGSHHTISVDLGDELLIYRENGWGQKDIRRLESSSRKTGSVIIVAVDYDEAGIAIYRRQGEKKITEIELRLPGKGDLNREVELKEALMNIAKEISEIAFREKDVVGIVVAGPGFLKEELASELKSYLKGVNVFIENSSMGGYAGVREAILRGKPSELLRLQEMQEIEKLIEQSLKLLGERPGYVAMGVEECSNVAELGAVEVALVLDELLSQQDKFSREKVEAIMEKINSHGGRIHVVPANTPAGERLYSLGGIICLLRFDVNHST